MNSHYRHIQRIRPFGNRSRVSLKREGLRSSDGGGEGTMHAPPPRQSGLEGSPTDTERLRPLRKRACLALPGDDAAPSRVALLFLSRGPAAILRRVGAVVVDSIQGVLSRWARSHVAKELTEVVSPLIAHRDATATVAREVRHLRVVATVSHRAPDPKLWPHVSVNLREAVLGQSAPVHFAHEAPA